MIKHVTDANFKKATDHGVTLVDFWATWCSPCLMQAPILEQLDQEMGDQVNFTKLDVDKNQVTATEFEVMSIPTLIIKKDGKVVERLIGLRPKALLKQKLQQYLK
ncbi:thioredoxin [Secundilactobacillus silagei]|uniref:Thioredoxin n=1 Tax=Secundilactobacillus silagei JCM 19001 TaxID=1302250 RepID=A0A1Z5IFX2_9LACO|nr:thioredoxin [Secundilactobacillus silagei]TDG73299.1 hypothetical protein C5L25_000448 [Secundilactobacillus silagei JCM 19001]GAX00670.1 thiol-disulfide isomerase/thioredoxin [Secundilactobacillus silagei JCM 19001]